jgi:hypothetical protein
MEDELLSIHEIRRRAPLHYWAKADNARFIAFILSHGLTTEHWANSAKAAEYHGSTAIAAGEAFRREAALALELIVKAVIARKIECGLAPAHVTKVPMTHDVPKLWQAAGLPTLPTPDRLRLHHAKRILMWAGRYAAPKTDEQFHKELDEEEALKPPLPPGGLRIEKDPPLLEWPSFNRLYLIALHALNSLDDTGDA